MSSCTSIYRFLEFEKFVDIVQRQALTFVSPTLWEDPYEAYVYKAINSVKGKQRIREILTEFGQDAAKTMAVLSSLESTIHAQSWTKCGESDALWRIYSGGNKAIRIEICREDIKLLKGVEARDVIYYPPGGINIREELKKMLLEEGKIELRWPFLSKREAFKYEEEVRLLTDIDLTFLPKPPPPSRQEAESYKQVTKQLFDKGEISRDGYENVIRQIEENQPALPLNPVKHVKFGNIQNFIKSVLVHPLAPDWHVQTVMEFCKRHKVRCLGKSQLYTLPVKW